MGCADCSNLPPMFDSRSVSSLPPTPQWEGIHWRVTDVLFLSKDSSCLMLLKIWSPPGDWRLCRMDQQSVKNTMLVGSLYEILRRLRKHLISNACILLSMSAVMVHVSHAYKNMDMARERISLTLELIGNASVWSWSWWWCSCRSRWLKVWSLHLWSVTSQTVLQAWIHYLIL